MSQWYMAARTAVLKGDIDFDTDAIRVALTSAAFVFDDNDVSLADVAGLRTDTHVVVSVSSIDQGRVLVGDVTFPNVTGAGNIRGLLVYKAGIDEASSPLIAHVNARADTVPLDIEPNGGDLTFSFNYLVKI